MEYLLQSKFCRVFLIKYFPCPEDKITKIRRGPMASSPENVDVLVEDMSYRMPIR